MRLSFQSDTLVSILPTINKSKIPQKNSVNTVEISSLPGSPGNHTNSEEADLVGPTSTELESFKELMQFDHVYFKPQPKGKTNSNDQIIVSRRNLESVQKVTENGSNMKNVQIVITSDLPGPQCVKSDLVSKNSEINSFETINIDDYDSEMLNSLNFDLLDDLENILKADTEGMSCPKNNCLQSQKKVQDVVKSCGQKRKASQLEIEAIVDTLTSDVPDKAMSDDSDYLSDIPSPYNACSPYSVLDSSSPLNDTNIESPLADSTWEESFTELFPDLL